VFSTIAAQPLLGLAPAATAPPVFSQLSQDLDQPVGSAVLPRRRALEHQIEQSIGRSDDYCAAIAPGDS